MYEIEEVRLFTRMLRGIMERKAIFTPVTMHESQIEMKKDLKFVPSLPENLSSAGWSLKSGNRFTPVRVLNNINPKSVFTPTIHGFESRSGKNKKEFTLDWWTESAIFRYNVLMVSAFYGMKEWNFRDYYNIPKENFLFIADSGGYQALSQNARIEPTEVLIWMEHNVDCGLTLDLPPTKSGEPILGFSETPRASQIDFDLSIKVSKRNYEIMESNRKSDKLQLLKVIHGYTLKELTKFHSAIKDIHFDGHAFGANQNDPKSIALVLGFAQTIEKERVHMFLVTGRYTAPIVIFGKRFFKFLTFDSSASSITGARYRKYFYPNIIGRGIEFGKSYTSTLKALPCVCPVCQLATVEDLNAEGSLPGGLIALHNLYQYLSYFHTLDKLADSPDKYIDFLKVQNFPEEIIKMIEYLICIEETDFETANKKFNMSDIGRKNIEEAFM